ncbi:MAG: exodeoxyribonuclease VII large subunit [Planctomycetota bacterium]
MSELTRAIKTLLESNLGRVWVEGEVSNLSTPRSGHVYFTLKDEHAAVACVLWRSSASRLRTPLRDGLRVVVRGSIAVYEPQGRYQIVCESVQPLGRGELQRRFEELVERLRAEGLFDPAHKKPLPEFPLAVGVVTSPTGAAVRDILRILRRRMPGVGIVLSPCKVQGEGAAGEVAAALQRLDASGLCEVIILGRGGGSIEDLWAFNEERVARAIFACRTPVISAVGHETDLTIADLVADRRAATPSEAAETAVPEAEELRSLLQDLAVRLNHGLRGKLREMRLRMGHLCSRPVLRDPLTLVGLKAQRLDETFERLRSACKNLLEKSETRLSLMAARLHPLSPLAVMTRGYSLTWDVAKRRLVRSANEITMGAELETRLRQGRIRSRVTAIHPENEPSQASGRQGES